MLTDKEMNNLITQINTAFGDLTKRLESVESRLKELEKPKTTSRKTT